MPSTERPPIFVLGAPHSGVEELLAALELIGDGVPLDGRPELMCRVAELAFEHVDARFVYVFREPHEAADQPRAVDEWRRVTEQALDALERLEPHRWAVAAYTRLFAHPGPELRRLTSFLGLRYDQSALTPLEHTARAAGDVPRQAREPELEAALERAAGARKRALGLFPSTAPAAARPGSPLDSSFTTSLPYVLANLRSSLLISTYQTGKLICVRARESQLNTHFRDFDKPMGLAVHTDHFALATRTEVWDFRDMPEAAPKIEPLGTHDSCFLPRNRHVTGDLLAHEIAYAGGELWVVATQFSCLATLDAVHSFVPRWIPPFIRDVRPGDACHLNGVAVRDDQVAFVSALGQTSHPGGWREGRAAGGCVIDVASSEIVAAELSMPHSPRWHDGRLWVLESGRGEIGVVDLDAGRIEPVAALPGFTRGLAFAGDLAFVGLSQVRETATFGDLPLTRQRDERICGVWAVDVIRGETVAFLRFEDLVQEIFDVALLHGRRYPEIAEAGDATVAGSFALP